MASNAVPERANQVRGWQRCRPGYDQAREPEDAGQRASAHRAAGPERTASGPERQSCEPTKPRQPHAHQVGPSMTSPVPYRAIGGLDGVYFEDSYVLDIVARPGQLVISLD